MISVTFYYNVKALHCIQDTIITLIDYSITLVEICMSLNKYVKYSTAKGIVITVVTAYSYCKHVCNSTRINIKESCQMKHKTEQENQFERPRLASICKVIHSWSAGDLMYLARHSTY